MTTEARKALVEKVGRDDDARYRVMRRKIMALVVDTWDGVRLIEDAAEAAISLIGEEMALEVDARRIVWNSSTSVHAVLTETSAAIRALTQENTNDQ